MHIYIYLVTKSCPSLATNPMTVAHQTPLSVGFPKQEYWSGLLFPSPGNLPDPEITPGSPALARGFVTTEPPGKPHVHIYHVFKKNDKADAAKWQQLVNLGQGRTD